MYVNDYTVYSNVLNYIVFKIWRSRVLAYSIKKDSDSTTRRDFSIFTDRYNFDLGLSF